ncbi:hypothetical protein DXA13_16245 [Clostridium sp. AM58-1XD]|nr:hypothetical protein DXA13_16245 [Clostridium sp. AM58-1XD]
MQHPLHLYKISGRRPVDRYKKTFEAVWDAGAAFGPPADGHTDMIERARRIGIRYVLPARRYGAERKKC